MQWKPKGKRTLYPHNLLYHALKSHLDIEKAWPRCKRPFIYAYGNVIKNLGLSEGLTEKNWFRSQISRDRDSKLMSLSLLAKLGLVSALVSGLGAYIRIAKNLWHLCRRSIF